MKSFKKYLFEYTPTIVHNLIVVLYNIYQNKLRFSGNYSKYKKDLSKRRTLEELKKLQLIELNKFLKYAKNNSKYYSEILKDFDSINELKELEKIPILKKDELRKNIEDIITIEKKRGIKVKTGGTTGKSLEVYFTHDDYKKRFATLDVFREDKGYKLGEKTAWFSGKHILNRRDIRLNKFWKYDFYNKIKYYSTFHCSESNIEYFLEDLVRFDPFFISGFPSAIADIAKYGVKNNIDYYSDNIRAIFTTSEQLTDNDRIIIETFFKSKVYNQYASSEGAPFIFECSKGNYHLDLLSGVIEIIQNDNQQNSIFVTSFHTHGTPLIRYDIGDQIVISGNSKCDCGDENPIIKNILGRSNDYIYSKFTGKVNSVNIANAIKEIKGIVKCQIIQKEIDSIEIYLVIDKKEFNQKEKNKLIDEFQNRLGRNMNINVYYVDNIKKESSGKFRLIKNELTNY